MQHHKYIIVRQVERLDKPRPRLGPLPNVGNRSSGQDGLPRSGGFPKNTQALTEQWQTESLSNEQLQDMQRDPEIRSITRAMPVSLPKLHAANLNAMDAARTAGYAWGVDVVAPAASEKAGAGLTVAVLDSGIDKAHPAFKGMTLEHEDFTEKKSCHDVHGHGTHCAATIFGRDVDGVRIGIARGVRHALIGKVLDDQGHGDSANIVDAIYWAQKAGANVISLSVTIDFAHAIAENIEQGMSPKVAAAQAISTYRATLHMFDSLLEFINARQIAQGEMGILLLAAAGNGSERDNAEPIILDLDLPAAAKGMLSVGAIERGAQGYLVAPFSNTNPTFCAPGVDIVSAKTGGGLIAMSGTSMAVPHAAGAALLCWEAMLKANPHCKAEEVKLKLLHQCRKLGFAGSVQLADIGAGLVLGP